MSTEKLILTISICCIVEIQYVQFFIGYAFTKPPSRLSVLGKWNPIDLEELSLPQRISFHFRKQISTIVRVCLCGLIENYMICFNVYWNNERCIGDNNFLRRSTVFSKTLNGVKLSTIWCNDNGEWNKRLNESYFITSTYFNNVVHGFSACTIKR